TGQRAFPGDSRMSTLVAVMNADPKPVTQAADGIPLELERIVGRCLRKDINKRAQHMVDIKLALEELKEESESGSLVAATRGDHAAPRRVWAGVVIALAFALIGVAYVGWRSGVPDTYFEAVPLTTFPGSERNPSFSPDASQVAFTWN